MHPLCKLYLASRCHFNVQDVEPEAHHSLEEMAWTWHGCVRLYSQHSIFFVTYEHSQKAREHYTRLERFLRTNTVTYRVYLYTTKKMKGFEYDCQSHVDNTSFSL